MLANYCKRIPEKSCVVVIHFHIEKCKYWVVAIAINMLHTSILFMESNHQSKTFFYKIFVFSAKCLY